MDVLMDNYFSGFVEEYLAAGECQHRVEVLHEETLKAEREQNCTEKKRGGLSMASETKPASSNTNFHPSGK